MASGLIDVLIRDLKVLNVDVLGDFKQNAAKT